VFVHETILLSTLLRLFELASNDEEILETQRKSLTAAPIGDLYEAISVHSCERSGSPDGQTNCSLLELLSTRVLIGNLMEINGHFCADLILCFCWEFGTQIQSEECCLLGCYAVWLL
jgi:hypothetical protein